MASGAETLMKVILKKPQGRWKVEVQFSCFKIPFWLRPAWGQLVRTG